MRDEATDFEVREHVPLADFTTLRLGGPARYFARATTREQASAAVGWASAQRLPLLVLGGGSNMLVGDDGFPGLALHCAVSGVKADERDGYVDLTVGAGEGWDDVVALAVENGWAGIECLSGIPGMTGASPIQNIGAYGQEVLETITRVEALDLATNEAVVFENTDCGFGYRESRFKGEDKGRFLVLSVTFRLTPGGAPSVRYAELARRLAERDPVAASLADVRALVLEIRRGKSMVLDAGDPDARSAGSFFTNPIVAEAELEQIEAREAARPGDAAPIPRFPGGDGHVKLPAAWLIERSGFDKGYARGRARLSTKHTLAIVATEGASASDVTSLAREIRDGVRERFGVTLTPEPVFVGCSLE